jgi:hypothetical protein
MYNILGATADAIGLTNTDADFGEAVTDCLLEYGISDAADLPGTIATDKKLRTLARMFAWKTALAQISADYNFADGGAKYDRGQMFQHIKEQVNLATAEALPYLTEYAVGIESVDYTQDPYEYHEPGTYVETR